MIGLGRMGFNMSMRLIKEGHEVVAYNRTHDRVREIKAHGAKGAFSLSGLVKALKAPRVVWIMLPAGSLVDGHIARLVRLLNKGDIIIDGGNGFYKDDLRRGIELKKAGINYMDVGVSGGIHGLESGYCLMTGGDKAVHNRLKPVFRSLAGNDDGHLYCGPAGAGHFVKMVHNGIEYGIMSAYAEGFNIIKASGYGAVLDLSKVAHLWNNGSVIRSWLLELLGEAFKKYGDLSGISGRTDDSGEGRWTVKEAIDSGVPAPVITAALYQRFYSKKRDAFSDSIVAALRREFGGHEVFLKNSLRKNANGRHKK